MTIDIDELERVGSEATAPPWDAVQMYRRPDRAFVVHHQTALKHADVFATGTSLNLGGHAKEHDADFVSVARNNWTAIIAELREAERLREENQKLKAFAKDVRDNYDCDDNCHFNNSPCRKCEAAFVLNECRRDARKQEPTP